MPSNKGDRMLFVALTTVDQASDGVYLKVEGQIRAFLELYDEVSLFAYSSSGIVLRTYTSSGYYDYSIHRYSKLPRRFLFWTELKKFFKTHKYSLVYYRYPVIDLFVLGAFSSMRKNDSAGYSILEIPSYPLEKAQNKGAVRILYDLDSVLHNQCSKYIDKVVYIGDKCDSIFNCKTQLIPNGFPKSLLNCKATGYTYYHDKLVMVAVSTMHIWHGYERVIEGIYHYYLSDSKKIDVEFILVGDGTYRSIYEELVRKYHLEDHVRFTGSLSGDALDNIYRSASIGVSSLGCYRKNLHMNSPLKTKEYMIRGLPYIYGYDEIGLPDDFEYALKVSNDSNPIDINEVVQFVERIEKDSNRDDVVETMRLFTIDNFSWEKIVNCIKLN